MSAASFAVTETRVQEIIKEILGKRKAFTAADTLSEIIEKEYNLKASYDRVKGLCRATPGLTERSGAKRKPEWKIPGPEDQVAADRAAKAKALCEKNPGFTDEGNGFVKVDVDFFTE